MFETIQSILALIITLITALSALLGFVVALLKNSKNSKAREFAEKTVEILELIKVKVAEVETALPESGLGDDKKAEVMSFISALCSEKNIIFDQDFWSRQIDSIVSLINLTNDAKSDSNQKDK